MKDKTAQRLLVFVPPQRSAGGQPSLTAATVVRYATVGDGTSQGEAPLSLLPQAREADLVFDCDDVFLTVIDAPRLAEARLRQALPNLLEDRLLGNPTDCQFAFDAARGNGKAEGPLWRQVEEGKKSLISRAISDLVYRAKYLNKYPGSPKVQDDPDSGKGFDRKFRLVGSKDKSPKSPKSQRAEVAPKSEARKKAKKLSSKAEAALTV
jgi:hypothetical protein